MKFRDLPIGEYFCFPKGSSFEDHGHLYLKDGSNCAWRIDRTGVDSFVWGSEQEIIRFNPKKVVITMLRDCFRTTEGLDCFEGDGLVVCYGIPFREFVGVSLP